MAEAAYSNRIAELSPPLRHTETVRTPQPRVAPTVLSNAKFAVVDRIEDLEALEPEWIALQVAHGRSENLFQTFAWVRQWCRHFLIPDEPGKRLSLKIVTGRINGVLSLVLPLVRTQHRGTCKIEWLGHPVSQYGDALVINDPNARDLLASALRFVSTNSDVDLISLRKVRADSLMASVLADLTPTVTAADIAPAISIPVDTTFDGFQTRYSAKARKNRRRHRRRLEERGAVTFERVTDEEQASVLIREALRFKRDWLNVRQLLSVAFADARTDAFFAALPGTLTQCPKQACTLNVHVLRCDNRPIAINVAFRCGNRMLTHIAAYDLEFERFSPGSLLFEQSIAQSIEQGVTTFDLMSPGDAYKLDWTDTFVRVHDYAIGLTAKGRAYEALYIRHLRPAMKHAATSAPNLARPFARLLNL